jgi:hypothetical protein
MQTQTQRPPLAGRKPVYFLSTDLNEYWLQKDKPGGIPRSHDPGGGPGRCCIECARRRRKTVWSRKTATRSPAAERWDEFMLLLSKGYTRARFKSWSPRLIVPCNYAQSNISGGRDSGIRVSGAVKRPLQVLWFRHRGVNQTKESERVGRHTHKLPALASR